MASDPLERVTRDQFQTRRRSLRTAPKHHRRSLFLGLALVAIQAGFMLVLRVRRPEFFHEETLKREAAYHVRTQEQLVP